MGYTLVIGDTDFGFKDASGLAVNILRYSAEVNDQKDKTYVGESFSLDKRDLSIALLISIDMQYTASHENVRKSYIEWYLDVNKNVKGFDETYETYNKEIEEALPRVIECFAKALAEKTLIPYEESGKSQYILCYWE